jgi:Zn-dependent protease
MATCTGCEAVLADSALSCTGCGRLVKSAELQALSTRAKAAAAAGDLTTSRELWEQAASLLPEDTVQYQSVRARIAELESSLAATAESHRRPWGKWVGVAGSGAAVAWKLKSLLLGLTKMTTLLSMFAFFGVYWSLYGWSLALGLVISIYIHEMGHVIAIRGYGLPATAPMFIPGFGAFIGLRSATITAVQDARIGLAGPIYGLGAALAALLAYALTGAKIWAPIAHLGAVINLFNLIPVWQLDGSRAFHSLTRAQRTVVLVTAVLAWLITNEAMLFLIAAGAIYRQLQKDAAPEPDNTCLMQFAGLIAALATVVVLARAS